MNLCFYCTTGRDFETFGYKVIYNVNFKDYVVKVLEIKTLDDLIYFSNIINSELILTDTINVIYPGKENYSVDLINHFLNKYPFAVEIYDNYRE